MFGEGCKICCDSFHALEYLTGEHAIFSPKNTFGIGNNFPIHCTADVIKISGMISWNE